MEFTAVRVTAHLAAGVSFGRPWGTSLDGILASVLWTHTKLDPAAGAPVVYDPHSPTPPPDLDLPLARCERGDVWHWAATFAHTTGATVLPDPRGRFSRTDRTDLTRLAPSVPASVTDARGHYRARSIPSTAIVAATATWRAVGDPDRITELLCEVTEIGKYRTSGEGRVTAWTVTPDPGADLWSVGHEHTPGVLGRITPAGCMAGRGDVAHGGRSHAGVRAPYTQPITPQRRRLPTGAVSAKYVLTTDGERA